MNTASSSPHREASVPESPAFGHLPWRHNGGQTLTGFRIYIPQNESTKQITIGQLKDVAARLLGAQCEALRGHRPPGDQPWAPCLPLNSEGDNEIIAQATDAVGRTGQDTAIVLRDTEPPEIEITSPKNGATAHTLRIAALRAPSSSPPLARSPQLLLCLFSPSSLLARRFFLPCSLRLPL